MENTHNCTEVEKCVNYKGGYECTCLSNNETSCDSRILILQPKFEDSIVNVSSQMSGSTGDPETGPIVYAWTFNPYSGLILVLFLFRDLTLKFIVGRNFMFQRKCSNARRMLTLLAKQFLSYGW